jgi:dCTP deaminase
MIVNGQALLADPPIRDMFTKKMVSNGVSYGLSELGYDIRIKQNVIFYPSNCFNVPSQPRIDISDDEFIFKEIHGNLVLASSIEEFHVPKNLGGIVHDKSTWARHGLSVFNTVIEPGWKGFLTLELVYHGREILHIPAGSGIAQVIFHRTANEANYEGKYQDQADHPVEPILQ